MKGSAAIAGIFAIGLGLSACTSTVRIDPGPDEFSILPKAALADPASGSLPAPGGTSSAEANPFALAYAALGGGGGATGPLRGAGAVQPADGGFWTRWFNRKKTAGVLDPAAEAARLRALGIASLGGS